MGRHRARLPTPLMRKPEDLLPVASISVIKQA